MLVSHALLLLIASTQPAQPAAPPPKPFDCSAAEHRQFDFWVGEWDVMTNPETRPSNAPAPQPGRKPASNVIEKAHKGCVIVENWDDGVGQTGQSFNIYDRVRKQWHQTWVDSNGGLHEYWGELKDGNMVFRGEVPLPRASSFAARRATMSPDFSRIRKEPIFWLKLKGKSPARAAFSSITIDRTATFIWKSPSRFAVAALAATWCRS